MRKLLLSSCGVLSVLAGISAARAADLPYRAAPPPPIVPAYTWTGFYIGANASGVVDGDFSATLTNLLPGARGTVSAAGYVAGGTVGYNYQFTPGSGVVVGVEGDVGYSDIHNKLTISIPAVGSASLAVLTDSYFATARGRIGYAFGPLLVYATGGYAATEIGVRADLAALGFAGSFGRKTSIDGYTVGGGLEYAITQNVSVKAEYLYSEFSKPITINIVNVPVRFKAGLETQQLKVGINYKFNLF